MALTLDSIVKMSTSKKIVLLVIASMTVFLGILDFIYTFLFKLLLGA